LTSAGADGVARSMKLVRGNPSYAISDSTSLFGRSGTELLIAPILPGVRVLSGDKIQNFLASELRDRIAKSGVRIRIVDHSSRREYVVEPRQFKGRLIHALPEVRCPFGEVYLELYFAEPSHENAVGLYKRGTRVIPSVSALDDFARAPWTSGLIEGIVDAPFLQLTPGTRDGIVFDEAYDSFRVALQPVEEVLLGLLDERRRAEEEEASRQILGKVTRALREAFLHLPSEDYGWLSAKTREARRPSAEGPGGAGPRPGSALVAGESAPGYTAVGAEEGAQGEDASFGDYIPEPLEGADAQRSFFDFPGPLNKLVVSPASSVIGVGESKRLKAVARDRAGRAIDAGLEFEWRVLEGGGSLEGIDSAYAEYRASEEPCVATVELRVRQGETLLVANALVTVTAELIHRPAGGVGVSRRGLPGYTYRKAPGELWRSRYDTENSIIVINNAHADFIYASRQAMTKVRYIARLFAKELVLANFPGFDSRELLERVIELSLYAEENLR